MAMVGADVDQLRTLARNLIRSAERLESMANEINGRLSATPWQGPDAGQFRSEWQGHSLSSIRGVVGALREAAALVERNADEQEQASSTTGAGGSLGPIDAGGLESPSVQPIPMTTPAQRLLPELFADPLAPFTDIRDFLGGNAVWPINTGFALGEAFPELGPVLPLLDALGLAGDSSLSPDNKIVEATHSLTDLGGGFLKDVIPGQFGYLAGVAVTQWGDVAYEVSKADFSPAALATTRDYIASDPGGAFDAARDAVLGYVPKLISNLWP
jgi:hypothetical protein